MKHLLGRTRYVTFIKD